MAHPGHRTLTTSLACTVPLANDATQPDMANVNGTLANLLYNVHLTRGDWKNQIEKGCGLMQSELTLLANDTGGVPS